tara:strand:+ start:857 stop:1639 length:783 start_codon:yes stop_codon:yes gene_type:complete
MAVSVNKVYQTVLAIANKEQRGYITPQEFNLFAEQAQLDIYNQYFYDINQFRLTIGNDDHYSDMIDVIEKKLNVFYAVQSYPRYNNTESFNTTNRYNGHKNQYALSRHSGGLAGYKLISITSIRDARTINGNVEKFKTNIEVLKNSDFEEAVLSPLTRGSMDRPICTIYKNEIHCNPIQDNIEISFYNTPLPPNWTYVVVNEKALYNATASDHRDFQLHQSEEKELVLKILLLAGISIKDYNVAQLASQEQVKDVQQQKI